jgi:peptidoglycan-associated lipoprotein
MIALRDSVRRIAWAAAVGISIFVVGCSTAKKKEEDLGGVPTAPAADENLMGDSDSGRAMGLQTVFFPYDNFVLTEEAKATLKANADLMKEKPTLKVQIEGHCDQRGGIQYNIALGEKRANSAKKYLIDLGVSEDRLSMISFGKEKPLDTGASEDAFAKNRRANFVLTAK